jgi:type I restriction enzyme S subunit
MPKIDQGTIAEAPIPAIPLPEQRRIVAEIEKQFTRVEAGVAALRRVQANLKRYRAAVLKAACEGRLVPTEAELHRQRVGRVPSPGVGSVKAKGKAASTEPTSTDTPFETGEALLARIVTERHQNWLARRSPGEGRQGRGQYKEPAAPETAGLPQLPEGWTWASVAQLSFLDVGFAFKSAEFVRSGIRLLRGENLEPGRMRWSDTRFWPEAKLDEFRQLLIREGQIVLAMDRPLISSGLKIARARGDDLPCLLVQRMARFRPIVEVMTSYLFTALNTHRFIRHLLGGQTGTQLPHISGEGIQSFPIPLPPLAEQTRIVAEVERRLSVVEELESVVTANLQRANRLRQSILKKAFTGELG